MSLIRHIRSDILFNRNNRNSFALVALTRCMIRRCGALLVCIRVCRAHSYVKWLPNIVSRRIPPLYMRARLALSLVPFRFGITCIYWLLGWSFPLHCSRLRFFRPCVDISNTLAEGCHCSCGAFAHVLISPILLLRVPIASSSIAVNKTVFVVLVHEAPLSVDNVVSGCCLLSGFVLVLLYCPLTLVRSVIWCGPSFFMLDPRR